MDMFTREKQFCGRRDISDKCADRILRLDYSFAPAHCDNGIPPATNVN